MKKDTEGRLQFHRDAHRLLRQRFPGVTGEELFRLAKVQQQKFERAHRKPIPRLAVIENLAASEEPMGYFAVTTISSFLQYLDIEEEVIATLGQAD